MERASGISGVGLGLRREILDELLDLCEADDPLLRGIAFLELSPENFMRRGGFMPAAIDRVRARFPIVTHGLMMSVGGVDPFDDAYFDELRRYLARTGTPFHSDHLSFSDAGGRVFHDLFPLPLTGAAMRHVAARAKEAAGRLELPFALENITHYFVPGRSSLDEAEFIADVLEESGAGLLLDVNNVYVNAQNYGFNAVDFLARMPLDRVVEIHVAGHERVDEDELLIDTHGAPVVDPVLALLTWAVARTGPVPVLLERDHHVPGVAELCAEMAAIDAAYQRGLAARAERAHSSPRPSPIRWRSGAGSGAGAGAGSEAAGGEGALLGTFARLVQAPDAERALAEDAPGWLAAGGLGPEDAAALAALGHKRLLVYRRHVRETLLRAVRQEIPRTAARLGGAFEGWVARFVEAEAPRSRYFRDVAFELVAWAAPRWAEDASVPPWLVDLARHELAWFEVASAPDADGSGEEAGEIALDRGVRFAASVRLLRYAFAVHRLEEALDARDVPAHEPTALLAYRDADHDVRFLELTPLAAEILGHLLEGAALGHAVVASCAALSRPVDPAVTGSTAALLEDLTARGALLGAEKC